MARTSVYSSTSKQADKDTLAMLKREFESCLSKVASANKANRKLTDMLMEAAVWKNAEVIYNTFANSEESKSGGAVACFDKIVMVNNARANNEKEPVPLRNFILRKNEAINGTGGLQLKVSGINVADYIVQANDPVGTIFDFLLRVQLVTKKADVDAGKLADEVFGVKSALPTWTMVLSNSTDNHQEESLEFLRAVLDGLTALAAKPGAKEEEFASQIQATYVEEGPKQINVMDRFTDDMKKSYKEKQFHAWLLACARTYMEVKHFAEDNLLRGTDSSINRILKAGQVHLEVVTARKWNFLFFPRRSLKKQVEAPSHQLSGNVRLAYTSVIKVNKSDVGVLLQSIVQRATVNNARLRITGALIVAAVAEDENGTEIIRALQVLEGPKENVLSLYDAISKDARHEKCTLLVEPHSVSTRRLGDWTMQPIDYSRWNYLVETAKLD